VYDLDTSEVEPECLEYVGALVGNEYYQQVSLKAITPNCRWSYKIKSETDYITVEFIV
jgi:hypothetical protein